MKILKPFTKWFTKTGEENKTQTNTVYFDYRKAIRERADQEREYLEKWKKGFKQKMNTNTNTSNHNGFGAITTGNLSSYALTNSTINTTSLANSAITINGDPVNGSVSIDVPLKVNGRDVMKELDEMRDALLLLKRDVDMETKYPRLRELKDEYERTLAKYKTFDALKESK